MENMSQYSGRACCECNRKKTKCDRIRPSCGLCQRTGTECTFPVKRKQPSSTHIAKSRQRPQPLRDHIDRLLHLLENNPHAGSLAAGDISGTSSTPPGPTVVPRPEVLRGRSRQLSQSLERSTEDESHLPEQLGSGMSDIDWDEFNLPSSVSGIQAPSPSTTNTEELHQLSGTSTNLDLSYSLVLHLVDVFFDRIQPWLLLLHKPSFQRSLSDRLDRGPNTLKNLTTDEKLLMYSLFALSSRFSSSPVFTNVKPLDRASRFLPQARHFYNQLRALTTPNLTYLQGCILLTLCFYTSELSTQGWILIGVCVRLAYDLGLSETDDDSCEHMMSIAWVRKEEMRRAWWAVWELDTFGSLIYRRPFSIDRRRMTVKLPVSDEVWFSGAETHSSRLLTRPGHCWSSLQDSDNRDERAWFLMANYIMSLAHDLSEQKGGVSADEKLAIDNEISCLKLSLPSVFNIETEGLTFDAASYAKSNWIIGTHLMMLLASFTASLIRVSDKDGLRPSQSSNRPGPARMRAFELSKIVSRWSVEYIPAAHPFFCCSLLPPSVTGSQQPLSEDFVSSTQHLVEMVITRFGEKWNLGLSVLRVAKLLHRRCDLSLEDVQIARCFAVYFPSNVKTFDKTSTGNADIEQDECAFAELSEHIGTSVDRASRHSINIVGHRTCLSSDGTNVETEMPALNSGVKDLLSSNQPYITSAQLNDDLNFALPDVFNFETSHTA